MVAHKFVRLTEGSRWTGPPDETCDVCGCDPRNNVHEVLAGRPRFALTDEQWRRLRTPVEARGWSEQPHTGEGGEHPVNLWRVLEDLAKDVDRQNIATAELMQREAKVLEVLADTRMWQATHEHTSPDAEVARLRRTVGLAFVSMAALWGLVLHMLWRGV